MKRFLLWSGVCLAIVSWCLLAPASIQAQQAGDVKIATAVICKNVVDRQPVEPGGSFPVSVGKLYCYTKIENIQNAANIVHAWYYGDTQRARISLNINPPSWRTYSSKIIQAHEIGAWRVEILDTMGNLLQTVRFETTP
ncbi:MAG: DUF2914 domain-containing protein [Desulfobacterales bacterium]|nr:MAG: DUF2914 domain-containing protein [Desulfobacterales bacterium]